MLVIINILPAKLSQIHGNVKKKKKKKNQFYSFNLSYGAPKVCGVVVGTEPLLGGLGSSPLLPCSFGISHRGVDTFKDIV
jgi:hypothetical protein